MNIIFYIIVAIITTISFLWLDEEYSIFKKVTNDNNPHLRYYLPSILGLSWFISIPVSVIIFISYKISEKTFEK